jgi:alpha-mannosidase
MLYRHDPWTARLPHLAASFDVPLVTQAVPRKPGPLPPALSLVTVEGRDLLLTAAKRCEAGERFVVRFYNAGAGCTEALVHFGLPVSRVHRSTAEEAELAELDPLRPGEYRLYVQPSEIVTLLVDSSPEGSFSPAG